MKDRVLKTAERFGITKRIESITADLLAIPYVTDVDFDLDGFYDDLNEVIILPRYDIPIQSETYCKDLSNVAMSVIEAAKAHGLARTLDKIEDYGRDLYIVFQIADKAKFYA